MQITPYLMFNGNCREAMEFYASVLGGKIDAMMTYAGSPAEAHVPAESRNHILHAHLAAGEQHILASDAAGQYAKPQGISVTISLKDAAEAERIFRALAENGQVTMPFQSTFWAERFGMCTDRFGIPWMINCEKVR
jgi:PhnB protein